MQHPDKGNAGPAPAKPGRRTAAADQRDLAALDLLGLPAEGSTPDAAGGRVATAQTRPPAPARPRPGRPSVPYVGLVLLAAIAVGEAAAISRLLNSRRAAAGDLGTLAIETDHPNAAVSIDGTASGVTPLRLKLPAGDYRVTVAQASRRREFPVTMTPGAVVSHHLDLGAPAGPVATAGSASGHLDVRTRPEGASVLVDGRLRGQSPLLLRDLPSGTHDVVLKYGTQQIREPMTVLAGTTVQLSATFESAPAARPGGWLAVSSPIELTVFENGRAIGKTGSGPIGLPVGRHSIAVANDTLGFRTRSTVTITAGQTVTLAPPLPRGTLTVNALPSAEVWTEDRKLGDTPLVNVSLPIGVHQLIFKHPSLGEQRRDVVVTTARTPVRVSVDMRR